MIRSIFSHANLLNRSLDASWQRNNVISNNIANIDTPNFKASSVEFESVLKDTLNKNNSSMKITNSKHISINDSFNNVKPIITQNSDSSMRMDGNNVDMEKEQANLAKNTIYYNTLVQKLSKEYGRLRVSINEGK